MLYKSLKDKKLKKIKIIPTCLGFYVIHYQDRTHTHHRFKITLPNTDQAHDKSLRVI
jgi:predicted GNAT family acetyltransferase